MNNQYRTIYGIIVFLLLGSACAAGRTDVLKMIVEDGRYSIQQAAGKKLDAYYPSPGDWRREIIYQIITDRFDNGEAGNDLGHPLGQFDPKKHNTLHGGDFRGIEKRLGYLGELGVTALWISPIVLNSHGQYHGYHTYDFGTIDPHWGTLRDLQRLIQKAHKRGIRIILDVICNHTADLIRPRTSGRGRWKAPPDAYQLVWRDEALKYLPPFDNLNWYHGHGGIDWNVAQSLELGELYSLDDLRTELPAVRAHLTRAMKDLITATDCDGFRVDTTRHVEPSFWVEWLPKIKGHAANLGKSNFIIFGESAEEDVEKLNKYLIDADGDVMYETLIDFPERRVMENVFAKNIAGPAALKRMHEEKERVLAKHAVGQMVRCLDNHDMERFLTVSAKTEGNATRRLGRLKLGITYLLTSSGVPIIYYGTEQAFEGGDQRWDASREDMFDGEFEFGPSLGSNFDMKHEMFQFIKTLLKLRKANPALASGKMRWLRAEDKPGVLAYLRESQSSRMLVAMNTDENDKREITLRELGLSHEDKIQSATGTLSAAVPNDNIITIPPQGIGIYHITR